MTDQPPRGPMAVAEAKVRHALLMVGMGFLALVLGAVISSALVVRVGDRLQSGDAGPFTWLFVHVFRNFWILVVLPVLANLAARITELRPLRLAVVAGLTGFLFQLGIQGASVGLDGLWADGVDVALRLGFLLGGVALTALAAHRGRAWAAQQALRAQQEALAKKAQYDEFAQKAKELAERREASPIAPVAPTDGAPAPAMTPAEVSQVPPPGAQAPALGAVPADGPVARPSADGSKPPTQS